MQVLKITKITPDSGRSSPETGISFSVHLSSWAARIYCAPNERTSLPAMWPRPEGRGWTDDLGPAHGDQEGGR